MLAVVGASPAQAAPHHFTQWFAGQFESAYAASSELVLRGSAAPVEQHFKWDRHTVVLHPGQKKPTRFDAKAAGALKTGAPLRVLYVKQGNTLLARRVVE